MVQIQPTPNPNARKVLLDRPIVEDSLVVATPEDAEGNALAEDLIRIPGVTDLFFLESFITVSKEDEAAWDGILPKVEQILAEHLG